MSRRGRDVAKTDDYHLSGSCFTFAALLLPRDAACLVSPAFNARSSLSIVATLAECLPCSIRFSVSGRRSARRASSACYQPKARRERTMSRASKARIVSSAG
jgi:hypothetical protein